jgi:hypothetical protein
MSAVVRIIVEQTHPLVSPIYWLHDAAEEGRDREVGGDARVLPAPAGSRWVN